MSRRIFKKQKEMPSSSPFQFQSSYSGSDEAAVLSSLEAEAELDAFQEETNPPEPMANLNVEELIERAQRDADQIVGKAKAQAAEIEREAYENGLQEGRKTGELMAEQQMQTVLTHYHQSLTNLDEVRDRMLSQMQLDILDLVLHTATKVIHTELQANPQVILTMVKEAIQTLKQRKNLTVYLNPDDHVHVMAISEAEKQSWLGTQVQLESDPRLSRGSFRIETTAGELDANVETQLHRLREEMQQGFERL